MSYQYSQNLKTRLIEYFKNSKGFVITNDQADEYLDSMAELYSIFIKIRGREKAIFCLDRAKK